MPPTPQVIAAANLRAARCLLVAIPDAFEGGQVVEQARAINPSLPIIARAHSEAEIEHLKKHGANLVVMGEHEIAKAMLRTSVGRAPRGQAYGTWRSSLLLMLGRGYYMRVRKRAIGKQANDQQRQLWAWPRRCQHRHGR